MSKVALDVKWSDMAARDLALTDDGTIHLRT